MKCLHCGLDSKYKDRSNRTCPGCKRRFAFEPRQGDPLTDQAFQHAIERVSGDGKLRWGAEHLYYEIARRLRPRPWFQTRTSQIVAAAATVALLVVAYQAAGPVLALAVLVLAGIVAATQVRRARAKTITLDESRFQQMLRSWQQAHGPPPGLIVPVQPPPASARPVRALEPDLADYSFDRAVVCDRSRTVDLLLANNFHFENNCAVLSIDGYPPGPFETVRTMLTRNPRLHVYALHDATVDGCTLAHRLSTDPSWFAGHVPVIDVGLRPGHAGPFRGLWRPAQVPFVPEGSGIKPDEAAWLAQYSLELAAIRPDQVLKRLFRAMNRPPDGDGNGDGDAGPGVVYFLDGGDREGGRSYVIEDQDSFSADAGADDGGADSFG